MVVSCLRRVGGEARARAVASEQAQELYAAIVVARMRGLVHLGTCRLATFCCFNERLPNGFKFFCD